MIWRLLADAVVLLHFAFILFVVGGALLVARWPRVAALHLPAAVWGILVEVAGWSCPLTPLELALRRAGGETVGDGSFIERYVVPLVYPASLTRQAQLWLGAGVLLINVLLYGCVVARRLRERRASGGT